MPADVDQLRAVIARADRHQELLSDALLKLENRISDLMATAPLRDGDLFDLEWALAARVELREAIEQEYLATVDSIVREYAVVADEALVMLKTYGDVTKIDPAIISQLQSFTFQGFDDLGQNFLDAVSKELYESTLTGTSFANSLNTIKQSVDASLGRYAKQALHDGLMQFDASINTKLALDAGATEFKYYGPDDSATRDFCQKHVGKTYTKEEIEEIWSGSWAGKISGDPFVVRGGYNCRHRFRGVF